jgi:hypothetical protein
MSLEDIHHDPIAQYSDTMSIIIFHYLTLRFFIELNWKYILQLNHVFFLLWIEI